MTDAGKTDSNVSRTTDGTSANYSETGSAAQHPDTSDGFDWSGMEQRCHQRWADAELFEPAPDDRMPKKFITVAYPYPNSPQHIGHGRTYTLADVHARYWRLKGFNVLFPMGFHYTGTPILGMARRVQDGDAEITRNLRDIYGVSDEDIATFGDPHAIAGYFHKEIKTGMKEMGYSIDWRREFTTIDPAYSKFIEWQISLLKRKGLIIRGSHPVGWCPKDQNPVSQHDTLGDVEPAFTEYTMVKFSAADISRTAERDGSDTYVIPTATLRPETVFGVTNLWVNPDVTYKKITVLPDGQKWIVSAECAYKLEFLGKSVTYDGEIAGSDLVMRIVTIPFAPQRSIPILPASFVEPDTGTGIVMSVPAHAPYDWQALRDAAQDIKDDSNGGKDKDGISSNIAEMASRITPISIIETPGYGSAPAGDAVSAIPQCTGQSDPRLEEITKDLYAKEFYDGVMKNTLGCDDDITSRFAGKKVREAKDSVGEWLETTGRAEKLLEITDAPVRCRCGTECVVKILNDQWFLNYGDESWKKYAHECLKNMNVLPDDIRQEFGHVVDWLHERACARQHGLGTRLPWDKDWIVESLSDSVIYMAYYTISRFVNDGTIKPEQMTQEFFDWVFLGGDKESGQIHNGKSQTPAHMTRKDNCDESMRKLVESGIPASTLQDLRREFSYFYPVDYRHSGRDLVPNHLTFFVLNHVAIFNQDRWPRGIVVNGSVLMDGSKMSKSMGNIIPLRTAIRNFGADPIRLAMITSAELLQDADFNMNSVHGMRAKLEALHSECKRLGAYDKSATHAPTSSSSSGDIPASYDAARMISHAVMHANDRTHSEMKGTQTCASSNANITHAEDAWLLSKIFQSITLAGDAIEKMRLREALHIILYEMESILSWHAKRAHAKGRSDYDTVRVLYAVMTTRVTMLQPFAPHMAEAMWEALGHDRQKLTENRWPMPDTRSVSMSHLQAEDLLKGTLEDIASILKVTKIKPTKITIYVADDQKQKQDVNSNGSISKGAPHAGAAKRAIYHGILQAVIDGDTLMGPVMKRLLADSATSDAKKIPDFVQKSIKDILSNHTDIRNARLASSEFVESEFLASEIPGIVHEMFGAKISVYSESDPDRYDPKSKARHARPFKPAILVE